MARIEKHIDKYLNRLDVCDANEKDTEVSSIKEKLAQLKIRMTELKELKGKVEAHPDKQISTTGPDSILMKTAANERKVCYNLQSAVDCKHHLLVAHDVTNTTDRNQLCRMGTQAQVALKNNELTVLANKGYFSSQDIVDAQTQV